MSSKATAAVAYSWTGVSAYKLQFYCLHFGVLSPKDLSLQFAYYCNFDNFIWPPFYQTKKIYWRVLL